MKLGHSADEIRYDSTEGTVARYVVTLENEPVMVILCDAADPKRTIRIARTQDSGIQNTGGQFTMVAELHEGSDGMPLGVTERVAEQSVYTYVIPRLHILLARLLRAA